MQRAPCAGGPPLVNCPLLLTEYVHSYPPYLEVITSIRNLRTGHAVVKRDPPKVVRVLALQLFLIMSPQHPTFKKIQNTG